jgi:EAL domain-containing protein (putative c-di-GMP-specific phosphodiesterase class I)
MQGYLFSKPVGKDEALELLRRHNSDTSVPNPGRKSA